MSPPNGERRPPRPGKRRRLPPRSYGQHTGRTPGGGFESQLADLLTEVGLLLVPEDCETTVARLADEVSSGRYHHNDAEYLAWYLRSAPSPAQP
jgi:hypothetical protein